MIQHLLIMMVGAPLILLSEPYPILLWGLPVNGRASAVRLMKPDSPFRRFLSRFSSPWLTWGLLVGATWLWHAPAAYDAALRFEVLHVLEHVSYFLFALLLWWQIANAAPRFRGYLSHGRRLGLIFAALTANEILGVAIAFATTPLYDYYTSVPRLWGISVMDDQALGGAIMWVPGRMMYVIAAVALLARYMQQAETREEAQRSMMEHSDGEAHE